MTIEEVYTMRLTDCHVIVKDEPLPLSEGLVMPEDSQQPICRGKVVNVGPGKWNKAGTTRIPLDVKRGDIVHYPSLASAQDMLPDGFYFIAEESIIGIEQEPIAVFSKKNGKLDHAFKHEHHDFIKYAKGINVGKLVDKRAKPVRFDMGKRK